MNVADLLWSRARNAPDDPAVVTAGGVLSFRELRRSAASVAAGLGDRGIGLGDRVAISMPRGGEAVAAYFGALAAGAVAVFVDQSFRPAQVANVLAHSESRLVLVGTDQSSAAVEGAGPVAVHRVNELEGSLDAPRRRPPDEVAQLVYTSGTTGAAKGVMLTHGNLAAAARIIGEYLGLRASDRVASVLPLSFVYGLSQLLGSVQAGAALVVDESLLAVDQVEGFRRDGITVLAGVPSLWQQWLATPGFRDRPIESLRLLTNAGGGLAIEMIAAIRAAQPRATFVSMYGLTEAIRSTYLPPAELDRRPGSIGVPIPESTIRLLREDGDDCAPGEVGEILQAGPTVSLGYWRDPERTARAFLTDDAGRRWVRTGDLARRDADGFLYYAGRRDRQVKSLGYRVNPEELELALQSSGFVVSSAVTTHPDPRRGTMLVAHVVLAPGATTADVARHCGRDLPRHLQPTRITVLPELPRLHSGKPDLARLATLVAPEIR